MDIQKLISAGKKILAERQQNLPPMPPEGASVDKDADARRKQEQDFAAAFMAQLEQEVAAQMPEVPPRSARLRTLSEFPPVIPERDNRNILIKGRWLERGGSAFLISTAGTGKSIWSIQFALSMVYAREFSGLEAWRPLKCWIIQSEDSDDRVSIDRDDIIAGLEHQCAIEAANRDKTQDLDWKAAAEGVLFADFSGLTGADFVNELNAELMNTRPEDMPDVLIINPFLDFLGGDASSQETVSAFLSGGSIGRDKTCGLRTVLKRFGVAALIVHHTGKPPSDKELQGWIKSALPEYQATGSSYITNWGRSFITMMKVPDVLGAVMLTAGKNGGGLKWDIIGGARRKILVWGDEKSVYGDGSRQHFWKEANEAQRAEILAKLQIEDTESEKVAKDAIRLAEYLHIHPTTATDLSRGDSEIAEESGMSQRRIKAAYRLIKACPEKYELVAETDWEQGPVWFRTRKIKTELKPMVQESLEIETTFL